MPDPLPALSLVAVPGRRCATVDLAQQIEQHGFAGIYVPSMFRNLSLCHALAWKTGRIPVGTAISAWREAGVTTPIIVPSSAAGNQLTAISEVFDAFAA
jgi:hypothetical protein